MHENLPFKGPLTPADVDNHGYYSNIYTSDYDKTILIKEIIHLRPHNDFILQYSIDDFIADVGSTHDVLLNSQYGLSVYIPPTQLVWGINEDGVERGYILMNKVYGHSIHNLFNINSTIAAQLDELISISLNIGQDNLDIHNWERRIPDIINSGGFINIMIGSIEPNQHSHPYLVDTYPAKTWCDYDGDIWREAIRNLSMRCGGFTFDRTEIALNSFLESPQLNNNNS